MTDRLKGCVVTFEADIREDDAEKLISAINMLKGVLSVETSVASLDDHMARERIRHEMAQELINVLYPMKTIYAGKPK